MTNGPHKYYNKNDSADRNDKSDQITCPKHISRDGCDVALLNFLAKSIKFGLR